MKAREEEISLDDLDQDVFEKILLIGDLEPLELLTLAKVNQVFRGAIANPAIWKRLAKRYGYDVRGTSGEDVKYRFLNEIRYNNKLHDLRDQLKDHLKENRYKSHNCCMLEPDSHASNICVSSFALNCCLELVGVAPAIVYGSNSQACGTPPCFLTTLYPAYFIHPTYQCTVATWGIHAAIWTGLLATVTLIYTTDQCIVARLNQAHESKLSKDIDTLEELIRTHGMFSEQRNNPPGRLAMRDGPLDELEPLLPNNNNIRMQ